MIGRRKRFLEELDQGSASDPQMRVRTPTEGRFQDVALRKENFDISDKMTELQTYLEKYKDSFSKLETLQKSFPSMMTVIGQVIKNIDTFNNVLIKFDSEVKKAQKSLGIMVSEESIDQRSLDKLDKDLVTLIDLLDINVKNSEGETPASLAKAQDEESMFRALESAYSYLANFSPKKDNEGDKGITVTQKKKLLIAMQAIYKNLKNMQKITQFLLEFYTNVKVTEFFSALRQDLTDVNTYFEDIYKSSEKIEKTRTADLSTALRNIQQSLESNTPPEEMQTEDFNLGEK